MAARFGGLLVSAPESEALARSVPDNGGVYMVPALSGLGAPHWRPEARGLITGISFATTRAHLVRAALEAQAHQIYDLMKAFEADGVKWERLRIDGGMVANDWLAQDLRRHAGSDGRTAGMVETTALGAAMLAAVGPAFMPTLNGGGGDGQRVTCFEPKMPPAERERRLAGWRDALRRV